MRLNCYENRQNNLFFCIWSDLIVSYFLLLANITALTKGTIYREASRATTVVAVFFNGKRQIISVVVVKEILKQSLDRRQYSVNRDEIIHLQILSYLHTNNTI